MIQNNGCGYITAGPKKVKDMSEINDEDAIREERQEERLQELESSTAHIERQLQDLNDVVADQWKTIDLIVRENRQLRERMESMDHAQQDGGPITMEDEKPPHY
jgi:SlyX protein